MNRVPGATQARARGLLTLGALSLVELGGGCLITNPAQFTPPHADVPIILRAGPDEDLEHEPRLGNLIRVTIDPLSRNKRHSFTVRLFVADPNETIFWKIFVDEPSRC